MLTYTPRNYERYDEQPASHDMPEVAQACYYCKQQVKPDDDYEHCDVPEGVVHSECLKRCRECGAYEALDLLELCEWCKSRAIDFQYREA